MLPGMEFQDVVRRRRMVRRFTAEPVAPAAIDRALRNAVRAPNAGFTQGWSFVVLDAPADVERFWAVTAGDGAPDRWLSGMRTAPVLVIPCSSEAAYRARYTEDDKRHSDQAWTMPYWHMDTAMATLLILQTAVDEGLGASYFGIPPSREAALRAALGIPTPWTPIGVVAIGHPDTGGTGGSPARRDRKPMAEVVHRGHW